MPEQPEMMRTKSGTRLVARASGLADGRVVLVVHGIEILMTAAESGQLRNLLLSAEQELERLDQEAGLD